MKIKIFCLIIVSWILVILSSDSFAQTSCGTTTTPRAQGLVSTPELPSGTSQFGTTGGCVVDPKAAFVPFKIPTYEDLKSLYYQQAKTTDTVIKHASTAGGDQNSIPLTCADSPTCKQDHLYHLAGNLDIGGTPSGWTKSGVIFIDGNLNINSNYTYGSASTGSLFIVKGNINIAPLVNSIDGVFIAEGIIYTAGADCNTNSISPSSILTINGSLVSLNQNPQVINPIRFCRTLTDNTQAAEKINHQVKYLILLRHLYSDTVNKWSEIP